MWQICKDSSNVSINKEELIQTLLNKQFAYYKSVLEIALIEREKLLAKLSLSTISPLMKQKQILLECVDELEIKLKPLKKYWLEVAYKYPAEHPVKKSLHQVDQILQELIGVIQHNETLLHQILTEYQNKISVYSDPS